MAQQNAWNSKFMDMVTIEVAKFELFGFQCDEMDSIHICGFTIALEMGIVLSNFFCDVIQWLMLGEKKTSIHDRMIVFLNGKRWMSSVRSLLWPHASFLISEWRISGFLKYLLDLFMKSHPRFFTHSNKQKNEKML